MGRSRARCVLPLALASALAGCAHLPEELKTAVAPLAAVLDPAGAKSAVAVKQVKQADSAAAKAAGPSKRPKDDGPEAEELAVHYAMTMLGKPYRSGGAEPEGFDPSGLVHYSFSRAGMKVPRELEEQRTASERVRLSDIRLGDLVYFDIQGRKNSHVGIYIGDGRFVHAASSGRRVRMNRLDTPYWEEALSEARRFAVPGD